MAAEDWIDFDYWPGYDDTEEDKIIHIIEVIHETEKARLVKTDKGQFWVPKSISRISRSGDFIVIESWFEPEIQDPWEGF